MVPSFDPKRYRRQPPSFTLPWPLPARAGAYGLRARPVQVSPGTVWATLWGSFRSNKKLWASQSIMFLFSNDAVSLYIFIYWRASVGFFSVWSTGCESPPALNKSHYTIWCILYSTMCSSTIHLWPRSMIAYPRDKHNRKQMVNDGYITKTVNMILFNSNALNRMCDAGTPHTCCPKGLCHQFMLQHTANRGMDNTS